jgi:DNA-binding HxlR family transcriptional regulator
MKRKCFAGESCPIARSLDLIGDWWSLLIVREALLGKRRFGEFQKSLGVAKNILTTRLRKLVACGVLEMVPATDGSTYQEYALTEKGRGLHIVLMALWQWAEGCLFESGGQEFVLVDRNDGELVRPLALQAKDGRSLGPGDVSFVPRQKSECPLLGSSTKNGKKLGDDDAGVADGPALILK